MFGSRSTRSSKKRRCVLALLCQALSPLQVSLWRCLLTWTLHAICSDAQVEENKSTTDRVFTDRSSHLQLAIVRYALLPLSDSALDDLVGPSLGYDCLTDVLLNPLAGS